MPADLLPLYFFVIFVFGLIVGSYLNVYILRLHTGKDTKGRSACASCGKTLSAFELVPLLSFLFLKGRCAKCKTRISLQYPIVELLNAIFYVLIFYTFGFSVKSFLLLPLASLSIAASAYDIKHKIIPQEIINKMALIAAFVFVYSLYAEHNLYNIDAYINAFVAMLIFAAPILFLWFISRGQAMGFADVKISFALFFLMQSPIHAWTAFTMAFVAGALFGLALIAKTKLSPKTNYSFKSEIAFGPFILFAFWLVYLSGVSLYDIILYI